MGEKSDIFIQQKQINEPETQLSIICGCCCYVYVIFFFFFVRLHSLSRDEQYFSERVKY